MKGGTCLPAHSRKLEATAKEGEEEESANCVRLGLCRCSRLRKRILMQPMPSQQLGRWRTGLVCTKTETLFGMMSLAEKSTLATFLRIFCAVTSWRGRAKRGKCHNFTNLLFRSRGRIGTKVSTFFQKPYPSIPVLTVCET